MIYWGRILLVMFVVGSVVGLLFGENYVALGALAVPILLIVLLSLERKVN